MTNAWSSRVLEAFGASAQRYNASARLQQGLAWQLAMRCRHASTPSGLWVDLGSGTGRLADALEQLHPGQSVLRLDGSRSMLNNQHHGVATLLHDLNSPLPTWSSAPALLCSNFVLHWLNDPSERLRHWYDQLTPEGWLALTVPVAGSFEQWHLAAKRAGVPCTALPFPRVESLLGAVPGESVRWQRIQQFSRRGRHPLDLLRPMIRTGADSTPSTGLGPAAWRRLFQHWPKPDQPTLSWHVLTLMLQR